MALDSLSATAENLKSTTRQAEKWIEFQRARSGVVMTTTQAHPSGCRATEMKYNSVAGEKTRMCRFPLRSAIVPSTPLNNAFGWLDDAGIGIGGKKSRGKTGKRNSEQISENV